MTPAYLKKLESKTNSGNWIGTEVRTAYRAGVKLVPVNVDEFNPRGLQKEEKDLLVGLGTYVFLKHTKKTET